MAYTNSANVKFPKADLIIEEDGSGNVTSCYNRTNNREYIFSALETANVKVNNSTGSNKSLQFVKNQNGYPSYTSATALANDSIDITPVLYTTITAPSGSSWTLISGDATFSGRVAFINGDCELTIS